MSNEQGKEERGWEEGGPKMYASLEELERPESCVCASDCWATSRNDGFRDNALPLAGGEGKFLVRVAATTR